MSEFTVEISRPGEFGALTSATLELPATQEEYHDAMQKARITDNRVIYSVELCGIKRDCLKPHIANNMHLLELNLLAIRMSKYIKDKMDVFEAMVIIESERGGGKPIPLPRLINMTFSIDNCHVAQNIASDTQLGKFLYENDFLSGEDTDAIQVRSEAGRDVNELFSMLGKEHRDNEGGIFTKKGDYLEYDGYFDEVYVRGEMAYFDCCSGATVVLEIRKGFFNDPGYDNSLTATINLPTLTDQQLTDALDSVEAASTEEIGWRCTDCVIPSAKELIDAADDLDAVVRFAEVLADMQRNTDPVLYKAMLEAVKPPDLEAAIALAAEAHQYELNAELSGPEDYSREILRKPVSSEQGPVEISPFVDHYGFGKALMERGNIVDTTYGLLNRKDGGPILSQADQPGMGMEMR